MSEEKKPYFVMMPFAGHMCVSVEAEDKESAKQVMYEEMGKVSLHVMEWDEEKKERRRAFNVEIEGWDIYEKIAEGMVLYPDFTEMEIQEE